MQGTELALRKNSNRAVTSTASCDRNLTTGRRHELSVSRRTEATITLLRQILTILVT